MYRVGSHSEVAGVKFFMYPSTMFYVYISLSRYAHYSLYSNICKYIHKCTMMHFVVVFFLQGIDYIDLVHLCKICPIFYYMGVP